jgi:leader peptidase (prepilin peptidase) / N-methyltransferase
MPDPAATLLVTILGLAVGSFLNVCIYRLPRHQSLVWPSSRCPSCRTALTWYDNIPVVSYAVLRGRCRACGTSISAMYPLVETAAALVFLGTFLMFGSVLFLSRLVFTCAMLVLFVIDLQHQILPNVITLPGIVAGLVFSLFAPPGWAGSLIGIIAGGGVLLLISEAYYRVRGEEGLGMGDVKMLAMIGAFLGWRLMLVTLVLSSFMGSVVGLGLIALKKGGMKSTLPFGTFLAIGAMAASVAGDDLLRWYLSFY